MLIPFDAKPHAKCASCNKYLSHFPIYIDRSSQCRPICGRCFDNLVDTETHVRDTSYEMLAKFLKFPCIYESEGCVESLFPPDVPDHEKTCPYRTISCALDCIWQGPLNELLNHINEHHPNSVVRNGEFEVDVLNSYEIHNFLIHEDEIFSFKRKFDVTEKVLECSLFCYKILETVTKYYYEITVFNGARNLSIKYPMKSADNYLRENITEIDIEKAKNKLSDPSIMIGLVKILTMDDSKSSKTAPKKENPELKTDMLSELECPVCFEYIIPPIYQCITGHSICSDCKKNIHVCPTCEGDIKNTQNFTLEKMALLLVYPCKFAIYGCDYTSKPGTIRQHQKYCLFGPQLCPLKDYENCAWKNSSKETYKHIIDTHHDNLLEIDNLSVFFNNGYFENEDEQCYIKKFSNELFKLHYRYSQNCFYWAMQLVGPHEKARNYKFEIDIIDSTNNNQKLFMRSFCSELTEKENTFSEHGRYVFFKLEQIRPFITDQLHYLIRIIK